VNRPAELKCPWDLSYADIIRKVTKYTWSFL
jgi:hypothetical protein